MKRKTDEFDAQSEDGRTFHILIYRDVINAGTLTNPNATIDGLKSARTTEGYHCNFIDERESTFEIVELGLQVNRV